MDYKDEIKTSLSYLLARIIRYILVVHFFSPKGKK